MIFSLLSSAVRSSLRVVATTLLALVVLSPVESCFAAEVTLAGKYSLELPDGWTAPIESKTELEGKGPGKAELWAGIFETDKPVEEVNADEIIGMNSEAGYKVIERGIVKHSSGSKAQLSRFQLGTEGQIVGVAYTLRLTPKEVVMLVVRMPAESMKTARSDIQAIFNSIKPTAASGAEDTWLTKPAESKGDSKSTSGENSNIAGTYASDKLSMLLKADGTFVAQDRGKSLTGTYTRDGTTLRFKDSNGETFRLKFEGEALVTPEGSRLIKQTESANEPSKKTEDAPPAAANPIWPCVLDHDTRSAVATAKLGSPTTMPGTDASIRFPAGWVRDTASAKDRILLNRPDGMATIVVYGRLAGSLPEYVDIYKPIAVSKTFRERSSCPYATLKGASGTATVFELRRQVEGDFQLHVVFAFSGKGPNSGAITVVDCVAPREMGPEERGMFEACLQSLKLPSASSR
ncbi:MAG: hypothetical protein QOH88_451 [Verrucomicrobiota bacterium]|jgi:hypothetical protein